MARMKSGANNIRLSLLARLVRAYIRSNLRGSTRLPMLLAGKFKSLQSVPVAVNDRYPIYVDLRADMSHYWLSGSPWESSPFEVDEQVVIRKIVRPGDTAFDIGANLGLHTTLLSQLVGPTGKVCAFEPNQQLVLLLRRTLGSLENTSLFPVALSDHSGTATLYVPNDHSMGSLADYTSDPELKDWRTQIGLKRATKIHCETRTLNSLLDTNAVPYPDFIKCDVEGSELMVFQGGREVLDRAEAPIIMFESREECSRGFRLNKTAAGEFLLSLSRPRYSLFEFEGGVLTKMNSRNYTSPNVLAVPQSKCDRITSEQPGPKE